MAEGVLLGLLLLNLGLPCYYSGARDYLSRRIHQLECDGRGAGRGGEIADAHPQA